MLILHEHKAHKEIILFEKLNLAPCLFYSFSCLCQLRETCLSIYEQVNPAWVSRKTATAFLKQLLNYQSP